MISSDFKIGDAEHLQFFRDFCLSSVLTKKGTKSKYVCACVYYIYMYFLYIYTHIYVVTGKYKIDF